jgi:hypothetical protein
MPTTESPTMTTTESPTMPTTTAYLAAHAALTTADALDDATACTCGPDDATCAGCDARTAYHAADRACDAARAAWLASDEPRSWQIGGEPWDGYGPIAENFAPSEIEEHLDDEARSGDWGDQTSTIWISSWARPVDPATGQEIRGAGVSVTTAIEVDGPDCEDGEEHEWRTPHSVLGGLAENPGVWGKGGGIISREVCAHCGGYRIVDTWAQDRSTGEQGLTSVSYEEADEDSLAWVAAERRKSSTEGLIAGLEDEYQDEDALRAAVGAALDADEDATEDDVRARLDADEDEDEDEVAA